MVFDMMLYGLSYAKCGSIGPFDRGVDRMRIITDSPALYSPEEGKALGIEVVPACTIIDDQVYRDFVDIGIEEFYQRMEQGAVPKTSQPAIGDILEMYESCADEVLVLPIGDGLSGTYQNMVGAKHMLEKNDHIHVVDTRTLAGPQRYLVQKAMALREKGFDIERIKAELKENIESSISFVIPTDFEFLRRSGRLTPVAAKLVTVLKIVPVLTQTEDKRRITLFSVKRAHKKAVQAIIDHFKAVGVNEDYLITVAHGGVPEKAKAVLEQIRGNFANVATEMFSLVPSLVSHGGPGCIVIQTIRK